IRFRFDWAIATTWPSVIVTTATAHGSAVQSARALGSATTSTRISAANAAAFEPVAISAVTLVGAPWYTSGAHMWNGTAEVLKPKPTSSRPSPIARSGSYPRPAAAAIRSRLVAPVAPYTRAMPYSINDDANAPSRKYFIDASPETSSRLNRPASTYRDSDISSSARNTTIRSAAIASSIMPAVANSTSA